MALAAQVIALGFKCSVVERFFWFRDRSRKEVNPQDKTKALAASVVSVGLMVFNLGNQNLVLIVCRNM